MCDRTDSEKLMYNLKEMAKHTRFENYAMVSVYAQLVNEYLNKLLMEVMRCEDE